MKLALVTLLATAYAAVPSPADVLKAILETIRKSPEADWRKSISPAASDTAAMLTNLRAMRDALQRTFGPPMSELSPPILLVTSSDTAKDTAVIQACVHVVQIGSTITLQLASFDVTLARPDGRWTLSGFEPARRCTEEAKQWLPARAH